MDNIYSSVSNIKHHICADQSKLRRNAFVKVCGLSFADFIITTGKLEEDEINILNENGITTIIAE